MLDRKTELMLRVASTLTAEELDELRGSPVGGSPTLLTSATSDEECDGSGTDDEGAADGTMIELDGDTSAHPPPPVPGNPMTDPARGARERGRTRASKVSTACLGQPREAHEWWPLGTELVGQIGAETFTAVVIENAQVKSGRSLQITSGAASGTVCLTPTRAAIEATEAYRQAKGLGRGGGITNGWTFWKPKA